MHITIIVVLTVICLIIYLHMSFRGHFSQLEIKIMLFPLLRQVIWEKLTGQIQECGLGLL